ncbi:MAG: cystathionine beta-lyase [Caulobacteraceae bacterium]|nr:cystathionine beta-lyase [Caulobacteraceae bacterium]
MIHAVGPSPVVARTVGPPIQNGSTVLLPTAEDLYDHSRPTYGRSGLATHETLRATLAELEGAADCQLYPSGVAALTGALLAVLREGDEILVVDSVYAPTRRFCDKVLARYGVKTRYYPARTEPEALLAMGGAALKLIVLESPGSLTFELQDVSAITALARARGVLTLLDNTWGAGLLFKPLAHGVDISVQALTKYVCGHSDVLMGSACASAPAVVKALHDGVHHLGWSVSGADAYQALRGLRTLAVRLQRHGESGLAVAAWLAEQPEVAEVLHPALPASPDHALFARDFTGACGLFSLILKPGPEAAVNALLNRLTLFGLGFSWGGFESLAISSGDQLAQRRFKTAFAGPLVRLHIGLEEPEDLIADLRVGLDAYAEAS